MTQIRLYDLPAFEPVATSIEGRIRPPSSPGVLRWGAKHFATPPAVGTVVHCPINRIGPVEITGYYSEDGYLGCYGLALLPPPWFIKQNGSNREVGLFGSEMELAR